MYGVFQDLIKSGAKHEHPLEKQAYSQYKER